MKFKVSLCICTGKPRFTKYEDPYPDVGWSLPDIGIECESCKLSMSGDMHTTTVIEKWNKVMFPHTKKYIELDKLGNF